MLAFGEDPVSCSELVLGFWLFFEYRLVDSHSFFFPHVFTPLPHME
jgi:hypothetical protein